jgi:hypothetical protein
MLPMIFPALFAGVAIAVFLVCVGLVGLSLPESCGVTALLLTIFKTAYDEWIKRNQFTERVKSTVHLSYSQRAQGRPPLTKDNAKSFVVLTVKVYNPRDFDIPIKGVELRFLQANLPDELAKRKDCLDALQCKWEFHVPSSNEDGPPATNILLAKRHGVDFVLDVAEDHFIKHIMAADPATIWIAVFSHAGEIDRISADKFIPDLRRHLGIGNSSPKVA